MSDINTINIIGEIYLEEAYCLIDISRPITTIACTRLVYDDFGNQREQLYYKRSYYVVNEFGGSAKVTETYL